MRKIELKDKKGHKIKEGDILKRRSTFHTNDYLNYDEYYVIKWDPEKAGYYAEAYTIHETYKLRITAKKVEYNHLNLSETEIVGNIKTDSKIVENYKKFLNYKVDEGGTCTSY